ncbi:sugar O-acyltransferase, sialic acid O-acetyltransferase NeuD family [Algoriphagus locisalis]|uniref:Sugar O-acyltransferase, sialic acid O-acetyltransferase NeuD family n=1 Tax=Algoriphagus locisalis TaxID=305507 RepID=A0A1I6XNJ8_9BACT|nr:DapH/DapD/GlmU-related protein [Algoriphagus locisalis]SFT39713.1 sugar O-acyltransferase, sialic acid O-acetyltransferase NeuD family [Algoriphagus locisalis]
MIIAGAGGHSLEVRQVLIDQGFAPKELLFFDEDQVKLEREELKGITIFALSEIQTCFENDPRFVLGVGKPSYREKLFNLLTSLGGALFGIGDASSSPLHNSNPVFDAMPYSFIGPQTKIGLGVLVNTRAHIHHECVLGDFSEIGPSAMLLGSSKIGSKCRIGAGAIILPGVEVGDEVVVGAGAVVTKNILGNGRVVKGIPAK